MLIPVKNKVIDIKNDIKPKDWRNKSDKKLPLKPKRLLILVLSGNMKLGSSGEYVKSATNIKIDEIDNKKPKSSIIRFSIKSKVLCIIFFISIK